MERVFGSTSAIQSTLDVGIVVVDPFCIVFSPPPRLSKVIVGTFGRGSGCLRPFSAIPKAAANLGVVWISASPVPVPFAGGDEAAMLGEERLPVTLFCIKSRERCFGTSWPQDGGSVPA